MIYCSSSSLFASTLVPCIRLPVYMSTSVFICLHLCLFIYLSVAVPFVFVCLYVSLSFCVSVLVSFSIIFLCISLFLCLFLFDSASVSVCLSVRLSSSLPSEAYITHCQVSKPLNKGRSRVVSTVRRPSPFICYAVMVRKSGALRDGGGKKQRLITRGSESGAFAVPFVL